MKNGSKIKKKESRMPTKKLKIQMMPTKKFGRNIIQRMMPIGSKSIDLISLNGSIELKKEKSEIKKEKREGKMQFKNKNKEKKKNS